MSRRSVPVLSFHIADLLVENTNISLSVLKTAATLLAFGDGIAY